MYSVTPALSLTGLVFGMHATAVKPPATAAATPVATVSLCSWPGSRRWTCMSINPGHTTHPDGISTTIAPSTGSPSPTLTIRSPSISRSNVPSRPFAGSTTRPPLRSRRIGLRSFVSSVSCFRGLRVFESIQFGFAREQVQHGHPHGDAVRHLFEDHRVRAVRHFRGDLDAAVHRAGVHDDHVGLRALHAIDGHPEHREVLAHRQIGRAHV